MGSLGRYALKSLPTVNGLTDPERLWVDLGKSEGVTPPTRVNSLMHEDPRRQGVVPNSASRHSDPQSCLEKQIKGVKKVTNSINEYPIRLRMITSWLCFQRLWTRFKQNGALFKFSGISWISLFFLVAHGCFFLLLHSCIALLRISFLFYLGLKTIELTSLHTLMEG